MTNHEITTFLGTLQDQVAVESLAKLSAISTSISLSKGTTLMEEGSAHDYFYILVKGSAKAYHWNDGEAVCNWFAFENDVLTTIGAYDGGASNETIELLEDVKLIQINTNEFNHLSKHNLNIGRLSFHWFSEYTKFLSQQVDLQSLPSLDRYEKITKAHPELLQRVSLRDLASYLGMRQETLSRVRAKVRF